jgi:hypothetical protein
MTEKRAEMGGREERILTGVYLAMILLAIGLAKSGTRGGAELLPWLLLASLLTAVFGLRHVTPDRTAPCFQFSLRSLLAAMLLAAIIFGMGRWHPILGWILAHSVWLAVLLIYGQARHLPVTGVLAGICLAADKA